MAAIAHMGRGSVSINRQGAQTRNSARPLDQSVLIGEEGDHGTGWDWSGRRDARHQPFAGVGEDGREGMRVRRRGCLRSIARGNFYFMGLILTRSLLCHIFQSMESVLWHPSSCIHSNFDICFSPWCPRPKVMMFFANMEMVFLKPQNCTHS